MLRWGVRGNSTSTPIIWLFNIINLKKNLLKYIIANNFIFYPLTFFDGLPYVKDVFAVSEKKKKIDAKGRWKRTSWRKEV